MKKILLFLSLIAIMGTYSCLGTDKSPLTQEQKIYAGRWSTNDGTWLHIYNDGGGSFKKSNSEVNGGSTTLTDSTLFIGIWKMGSTYSIDKPPYQEGNRWKMELNGDTYVRN